MNDFNMLLQELASVKEQLKRFKDKEAELNKQVKQELDSQGIEKGVYNGIKVTYTTCTKSSINEDKLLAIVKQLAQEQPELLSCIETKEVINENTLEELMYQGFITPGDIQAAYEEKQYKTLKLKKVK